MSPDSAHITPKSLLTPTINAWKIYLEDQGNSPHTVKAFTADLRLLASYLPPDYPLGNISTTDLNSFLEWMQKSRGIPCSQRPLLAVSPRSKLFFRWLHQNGVLIIDPAEKSCSALFSALSRSYSHPTKSNLSWRWLTHTVEALNRTPAFTPWWLYY